ncbi:MAG: rhodanese-like domain-containing protein [Lutibacter sp.]|nr:rhodanese-like domain-containing protein [Lutibacter sp.]
MKKLSLLLIGLLLIPTLFLSSCDKGDDSVVNTTPSFTVLKDYMLANNLDINTIDADKAIGAPTLETLDAFLAKYYIIDIRSAVDYASKHITGAKNVAFANILAEGTAAGTKPILIVCYTGQTACYATALMRMYGFKNTQALKWGMSGWNSTTAGAWNGKIGVEEAKGHANWSYNPAPTNMVFTNPLITTLSTDGATILKSRIEAVVAEGFKTVTGTEVLNSPNNYFINNYFSSADYAAFGHIKNAYRINPLLLADNSYLNIDPSSKVVTYCYTGQTSAVVTACLRVLGYDAYSMSYGMNGLYHTNTAWTLNQWGVGTNVPKNLPFAAN